MKVWSNGRVHVMRERCSTCIFRGGNLMHLQSGRVKEMVDSALAVQSVIVCHKTIHGQAGRAGGGVPRLRRLVRRSSSGTAAGREHGPDRGGRLMGFALACFAVAAVASVLEWLLRDRSTPAAPVKKGAAWEQDEPMPECFDEMEGDL